MAKKNKIDSEKLTNGQGSDVPSQGLSNAGTAKTKGKKAAARKRSVRAPKGTGLGKVSSSPAAYDPPDEEVRIRAYFIAERRMQLSLQGDSDHDWIEAKRQLIEEASRSAS